MVSFYPGQKANEIAKSAQERYERAVEQLKKEEEATNKLAEEYGQLQLDVIRHTVGRFVAFIERNGKQASQSDKRLLEGVDFSVQQIKEYKAAAIGAEKFFMGGANYKKAIADFTQVIKTKPDDADLYFKRGYAHGKVNNYQGAIADFTQVIKLKPNEAINYLYRGHARSANKDYDGAIADYSQVIKIEPNCTDAYFNRGCVRYEKGDKRRAIGDYNQVIKIEPDYAYAYVKRGSIRREKAEREEAIADFQKAISIFRKESMMHEVQNLQKEIRDLQNEIKNTPWWQTRVFTERDCRCR